MNKSQNPKNDAYNKYYSSNIFNFNSNNKEIESNKYNKQRKQFHLSINTKENIFNIGK